MPPLSDWQPNAAPLYRRRRKQWSPSPGQRRRGPSM